MQANRRDSEHPDRPARRGRPAASSGIAAPAIAGRPRPGRRTDGHGASDEGGGDSLPAYLGSLRLHGVRDRVDEQRLAERYAATRDPAALAALVSGNLRLVVKIAAEYRGARYELADLIQEGNLGLLHAVERFDPSRGVKVSTYAAWWIRAYVLRYILANARLVKLGTTQAQRRLFFNLQLEKARLDRLGVTPDPEALAARMGVRVRDVVQMEQRLSQPDTSLDAPPRAVDGSEGRSRFELISDGSEPPDERLAHAELLGVVRDGLDAFELGLDERERVIVRERWRLERPATLEAVAGQLHLSRERVRQIEDKLLQRLRRRLRPTIGDLLAG